MAGRDAPYEVARYGVKGGAPLPVLRTARIVFDVSRQVKEANCTAMDLTGGRALPGTPRSELHSVLLGALDREPPIESCPVSHIESCPPSPCRFFSPCVGVNAFLINYDRNGEDLIVRFEPLTWTVGFSDQLSDLVFITNTLNRVAYVNEMMARRLEQTENKNFPSVSPSAIAEYLGLDETVVDQMAGQALNGVRLKHGFESKDGLHHGDITGAPMRYCGQICGAMWLIHEMPKAAFHDMQALAALSYRMAAMYQHEIRNPLQTVTLACRRDHGTCGDLLDAVDRNIRDITEMLGEHIPPAASTPAPMGNLSATVARAITHAQLRHSSYLLSFDHVVQDFEPCIRYHNSAMRRIFANLFRNAAQARPDAQVRVSYCWTIRY